VTGPDTDMRSLPTVAVAIPTLGRESVLLDTIDELLDLEHPAAEILIVDQTPQHRRVTEQRLRNWDADGTIRWIRLPQPSIPAAMNRAVALCQSDVVLFLDDDIRVEPELVRAHAEAHRDLRERCIVAGRVIQPWEESLDPVAFDGFRFCGICAQWISEFMGGNFSVPVTAIRKLGGFDENFVRVAYRFEAEFANRWLASGGRIRFEPAACIHHLKAPGGTRLYGDHLRTASPAHSVGHYYYTLRTRPDGWIKTLLLSPLRAVATRFHLRHPWWIPPVLAGNLSGLVWAAWMTVRGPRLPLSAAEGAGEDR
jgi:glycosyltransferase involved in cell wall biosynthesis